MPLLDDNSIRKIQSSMDNDNFTRSAELLKLDGITLLNLEIRNESIVVKIIDRSYRDVSQMVGRVARLIAKTAPLEIKFITIEMIDYQAGYSVSKVTLEREKLKSLNWHLTDQTNFGSTLK